MHSLSRKHTSNGENISWMYIKDKDATQIKEMTRVLFERYGSNEKYVGCPPHPSWHSTDCGSRQMEVSQQPFGGLAKDRWYDNVFARSSPGDKNWLTAWWRVGPDQKISSIIWTVGLPRYSIESKSDPLADPAWYWQSDHDISLKMNSDDRVLGEDSDKNATVNKL